MTAGRLSSLVLTLSFVIWIVYGTLQGMREWPEAVLFGLMASAGLLSLIASKHIKIKLLDWVLLGYFALAGVATFVLRLSAFAAYSSMVIWGLYAIVTWISIAVGAPFTVQYARESAPPEHWNSPGFLRVNRIISAVWGAGFVLNLVLCAVASKGGHNPLLLGVLAPFLVMGVCALFTAGYKKKIASARAQLAPSG